MFVANVEPSLLLYGLFGIWLAGVKVGKVASRFVTRLLSTTLLVASVFDAVGDFWCLSCGGSAVDDFCFPVEPAAFAAYEMLGVTPLGDPNVAVVVPLFLGDKGLSGCDDASTLSALLGSLFCFD